MPVLAHPGILHLEEVLIVVVLLVLGENLPHRTLLFAIVLGRRRHGGVFRSYRIAQ